MLPSNAVLSSSRDCLAVADEGTALVRHVGNKSPTTQDRFPGDRNPQQHSCENLQISQERKGWGTKKKHACRCKNEFSESNTYLDYDTGCCFMWVSHVNGATSLFKNVVQMKVFVPSREEVTRYWRKLNNELPRDFTVHRITFGSSKQRRKRWGSRVACIEREREREREREEIRTGFW